LETLDDVRGEHFLLDVRAGHFLPSAQALHASPDVHDALVRPFVQDVLVEPNQLAEQHLLGELDRSLDSVGRSLLRRQS